MNAATQASLADGYADRYFFRTADKMRLEGCVHAVGQEGQSLTLCCEEEALLDHYLQLLLSELRKSTPQHKIEVYFPTSPDSLIARFNEALSHRKVEEAARAQEPGDAGQIWVIHDPTLIADAEMQLLARLIQSLPGANIRLIVLLAGTATRDFALPSLKRQMLRWDIDLPSAEQALAALEFSERSGALQPLRRLLTKLCALDPVTAAAANELAMTPTRAGGPGEPAMQSASADIDATPAASDPLSGSAAQARKDGGKRSAQMLKLGALLGSALVISTGLMMWMQPQSFGIAGDKADSTPASIAAEPAKPAPAPAKPAVQAPKPAAEPAKSAAQPAKPVAAPAKPVAEAAANPPQGPAETSKPKVAEPNTSSEPVTRPAMATSTPASPSPAAQPEADSARRLIDPTAAAQWMRELAPGSFVIWHAVFPGYDAALAFRKNHRALERSVIVSTWRNGQNAPLFAVISAPFASAAQAYAALKSDAYPPNNWVRPARDVQAELATQNAVARRN